MLLKNTPEQIKRYIQDTMKESLKSYISTPFYSQNIKDITDQLNKMPLVANKIIVSRSTWLSFLGITDKIIYKCC